MNAEPTFGGLFPDADSWVELPGIFVRSGPRTYQYSQIGYAVKLSYPDRGQMLYMCVMSGRAEFIDEDTVKETGTGAVYSAVDRPELIVPPLGINGVHNQDKDHDGLPDLGEKPFLCVPFDMTMKRFPLMAPCTP
jgi:hypothetical protein